MYGEHFYKDSDVATEYKECATPLYTEADRVNDIPDEELQETLNAKVLEVATALSLDNANDIAARIRELPLKQVLKMIMFYNTPEYRDKYLASIRTGVSGGSLDSHVLSRGRPSGSLEEVSTICHIISLDHLTPETLNANYDQVSPQIMKALNSNHSKTIQIYMCGNLERFIKHFNPGCDGDTRSERVVCKHRNIQIAGRINITS